MSELTIPDVLHRLPPLVEEARRFLRRCRRTKEPRVYLWRGPKRGAAVYPGSFDPWTLAHEAILRAARRRVRGPVLLLLDLKTIDKPEHASGLAERLAILALHFAEDTRVSIGVSTHGRFLEKALALGGRVRFIVGEDTWDRVISTRYYKHPERELAELHARAEFLVAPRGRTPHAPRPTLLAPRPSTLPLSRLDQARSATKARAALSRGRAPFDQLSPDVLLCCWQLRLYNNPRLLPVWVVTAFLTKGDLILLLRRGARVGTYQGLWSGVSGYLDWPVRHLARLLREGPGNASLRQVLREVREETGVPRRFLRLARQGQESVASDAGLGREWRVCPFLFDVPENWEPRLDWENTTRNWWPPEEVARVQTVPKLHLALGSALGGWRAWFKKRTKELETDRRSGSMTIARGLLRLGMGAHVMCLRLDLARAAQRLARAHPMGVLAWVAGRLASGRSARVVSEELDAQDRRVTRRAIRSLTRVPSIVTYSNSSTVWWMAIMASKPVTVLSDREGHSRRFAEESRGFGFPVRLSPHPPRDAILVIGADAVMPDGSIINARGTANAIRQAGLPVLVLAQKCKYVKRAPRLRPGFERVPASLLRDAEFIS